MAAVAASTELLQAFNEGSLGVSFGIAGFLAGYLAGVAYLLAELNIITPTTKIAGASSGALVSMGLCSGIPSDHFLDIAKRLSNHCRQRSNCQGSLGAGVIKCMEEILPPDAYRRCSNKAFMSISVGPFPGKSAANKLVGEYSSNADFSAAGHASSYIPLWSGANPTTTFRGQQAYDGFFTDSQPCPPGVRVCIKINSRNPPWSNSQLDSLFKIISRTASAGPSKPARLAYMPAGANLAWSGPSNTAEALRKAASLGVDIAPGIYSPTGMSNEAWEELVVLPGDDALNRYLYQLGRRDALIWARATGLEAAAAAKRDSGKVYYSQG